MKDKFSIFISPLLIKLRNEFQNIKICGIRGINLDDIKVTRTYVMAKAANFRFLMRTFFYKS